MGTALWQSSSSPGHLTGSKPRGRAPLGASLGLARASAPGMGGSRAAHPGLRSKLAARLRAGHAPAEVRVRRTVTAHSGALLSRPTFSLPFSAAQRRLGRAAADLAGGTRRQARAGPGEQRGLAAGSRRGRGRQRQAGTAPARGQPATRPALAAPAPFPSRPPQPARPDPPAAAPRYRRAAGSASSRGGRRHGTSVHGGGVCRRAGAAHPLRPRGPHQPRHPDHPLTFRGRGRGAAARTGLDRQATAGIPRGTHREAPMGSGGRCPAELRGLRALPGRAGGREGGGDRKAPPGRGFPRRPQADAAGPSGGGP